MQLDLDAVVKVLARFVDQNVPACHQEQPALTLEEKSTRIRQWPFLLNVRTRAAVRSSGSITPGLRSLIVRVSSGAFDNSVIPVPGCMGGLQALWIRYAQYLRPSASVLGGKSKPQLAPRWCACDDRSSFESRRRRKRMAITADLYATSALDRTRCFTAALRLSQPCPPLLSLSLALRNASLRLLAGAQRTTHEPGREPLSHRQVTTASSANAPPLDLDVIWQINSIVDLDDLIAIYAFDL